MKRKNPDAPMSRSQSGKMGKEASPWRHGWGGPLSPRDKTYSERIDNWRKEKSK